MANNSEDIKLSEEDQAVLGQLKSLGSDLSLPHPIDHYLYFREENSAKEAEKVLRGQGFSLQLKPPPDSSPDEAFLVLVSHTMVPEEKELARVINSLKKVATDFNGDYDGWEAAIIK